MDCQYQNKDNSTTCKNIAKYRVTGSHFVEPLCLKHAAYLARVSQRIDFQVQNIETNDVIYDY